MTEEAEEEAAEPGYEFGESFQSKIIAFLMRDTTFAQRTEGLIDPAHFASDADAAVVALCVEHYGTYKEAPKTTIAHILKKALLAKKIRADLKTDVLATIRKALRAPLEDRGLLIDEIASFAKNRAMERAIIASAELLDKKDYAKIAKLLGDAMLVGAVSDAVSYDYWKEVSN